MDRPPKVCPQCGTKMRPDPVCSGAHFCGKMGCDYAIIVGLIEKAREEVIASEQEETKHNMDSNGVK